MSKRFLNVNKYRNMVGKVEKKELWYADLLMETSSSSDKANLVQASRDWIAVKWSSSGSLGIIPLSKPGKTCAADTRVFHAHGAPVTDWQFSEFNDNLLATGAEDGLVKLWDVANNDGGSPASLTTLNTSSRRVDSIAFHPSTEQIVATLGNDGKQVAIWDVSQSRCALQVPATEPLHSFSWKSDGALMATTGKGTVNIWDPRAPEMQVGSGKGHEGAKGSRVQWLGESSALFTVGMSKFRTREYALWDVRQMATPLKKSSLDSSTGIIIPLYDEDTETIYLIGRGEATVRSLQLSDLNTAPTVSDVMSYNTSAPVFGATLLRKQSLDVMHAEVARVLAVVDNAVMPVSFQVPRKQYIDFHADLYPDTKGSEPGLSAEEWLAGKTASAPKVSLDPSKVPVQRKETPSKQVNQESASSKVKQEPPVQEPLTRQTEKSAAIGVPSDAPKLKAEQTAVITERQSPQETINQEKDKGKTEAEPQEEPFTASPVSRTQQLPKPKVDPMHPSVFKYITGKLYHRREHFEDLRGLSTDKTGNFDLIQANMHFIAVPLSGPGGRVGIIPTNKPGRLPVHIPCVLGGSPITTFAFDPFNDFTLVTASEDNKIRVWQLPNEPMEQDITEPVAVLSDPSMDKLTLLQFHPNAANVLLTASHDFGQPNIRLWDMAGKAVKRQFDGIHKDAILSASWSIDGSRIATHTKEKKLRVLDAHAGTVLGEAPGHNSVRPSRLVWLSKDRLASVGFGLGSARELLLYDTNALAKGSYAKKVVDVSPSVMSVHYDLDCRLLYVGGRGDRIIHTFGLPEDFASFEPLVKLEESSLQQGFAFLPKRVCAVKDIEIARYYRLTPTSIELAGVRVPRARPEYFQDELFIDTRDTEHASQDASSWFSGTDKPLARISLRPEGMPLLSDAPPPPQQAAAKKKFEATKRIVSEDEKRQNMMERMFLSAKEADEEDERRKKEMEQNAEDKEVEDDEWDD